MDTIGLDLQKRESQLCVLTDDGEIVELRIATTGERFAEVLGNGPLARILLEASTESGGWPGTWCQGSLTGDRTGSGYSYPPRSGRSPTREDIHAAAHGSIIVSKDSDFHLSIIPAQACIT